MKRFAVKLWEQHDEDHHSDVIGSKLSEGSIEVCKLGPKF